MLFLKKYWFEIMIGVGALMVLGYIKYLGTMIGNLENDKLILQSKVNEVQGYLNVQNMIIKNNRADYEIALNHLPTVLKSIDTKYKTEVVTIEKWRDKNVTNDCNSSMQYLNTYQF
jgi:GTPase involved in cell partitioning and DNA repair